MTQRTSKGSHLDTVHYEIRMLRFCFDKLKGTSAAQDDLNLSVEGFLLHYRNLIRFFSGKETRHADDLSTSESAIWAGRALTGREKIDIQAAAIPLDGSYFQAISKYLQHCTTLRHGTPRDWDEDAMIAQLSPIIAAFEAAFPRL